MNYKSFSLRMVLSIVLMLMSLPVWSQVQTADKIIGVVGNKIVLQSDVDLQYENDNSLKGIPEKDAKCNIIYTLLAQQLLVEEADRDSVVVSDDDVEKQIDQRIQGFIAQYGSREALEHASGQTIYQLKETYRTFFRDKLTAEKMQGQLMADVKITPTEVQDFYNKLSKDSSLRLVPAQIQMGQLIIQPTISKEIEDLAREKMEDIRKEIVTGGKSFATMASLYSVDPSRNSGGLITITRKGVDPKFAAAAFRLQPGEISPVIRSRFGYHIIQMVKLKGDEAEVRHILIVPEVTRIAIDSTIKRLDSIRNQITEKKITFSEAVGKYTTDDNSKMTGGMVFDPMTGSISLEIGNLKDPDLVEAATNLKVGEISKPSVFRDMMTNAQECRILYLKSRSEPHTLNLKDDYNDIQLMALHQKQNDFLADWVRKKSKEYYIHVDPEYTGCSNLAGWQLSDANVGK